MKRIYLLLVTAIFIGFADKAFAQEEGVSSIIPGSASRKQATGVSPYYFGPNAFPIPDMLINVSPDLRIELAGDYYHHHRGGYTADIFLKANIPLWTRRANLSLWMPVMEWYHNTRHNMETSLVDPKHYDSAREGTLSGDVYVSIDLQLFLEGKYRPSWTLRAALKTASGGDYDERRYYDCPGYFFDTYFGKQFLLSRAHNILLNVGAGGGFMCWQTAVARQNDAIQYGVMAGIQIGKVKISEEFAGYSGWENHACNNGELAHDCPMSLKTQVSYFIKNWEVTAIFQQGLRDYPYSQFRLGAAWHFDYLSKRTDNKKKAKPE